MRSKVSDVDASRLKFIDKSNKRHNYKYDYSKVNYINSITKVEIICDLHGSFFVRPDAHIRKVGCPNCNGGVKYNTTIFIYKSVEVHNNKYDYSLVEYINSNSKVKIICEEHGIFNIIPKNHLKGQGCPSCSGMNRWNLKTFVEVSINIHNGKYNYESVIYKNISTKVDIICSKHGIFSQTPKDHLKGHGCRKCSNFSNGENKIETILSEMNIFYIREYKFDSCLSKNGRKLPFDFYLPDFDILIEYDGRQHYEPVEAFGGLKSYLDLKENDSIKDIWCDKNSKKLIRISYKNECGDIDYLIKFLNGK